MKGFESDLNNLKKDPVTGTLVTLPMSPIVTGFVIGTGVAGLTDVAGLSVRLPEYNRLKKAAAGHAAVWHNPDSLIAHAHATQHH